MIHTYKITGMTCGGCEAKVKSSLLSLPDVTDVEVSKETNTGTVSMEKHVPLNTLQLALKGENSKYKISVVAHNEVAEQAKSWVETYRPIFLIFSYITGVSFLIQFVNSSFNWMQLMNHFMAGFFLVFSFFKILNLKGFAESYAMYDIVAKRWTAYGYIYPFIELALGISFLIGFNHLYTNIATCLIMTISIIGVLQSVLNKKQIKCACLGAVFNLPMSTITILEDALMILMSAGMIYLLNEVVKS